MIAGKERLQFDWVLIGMYASLLLVGWLAIYSTTYEQNIDKNIFDLSAPIVKQSLYIIISISLFLIIQTIGWKFWHTAAYIIYGIGIVLLLGVLIFGSEIKGAKAWFTFGGFSFQPSEIAKFGTALALSSYLCYFKSNLKILNSQLIAFGIIFLPVFFILLQPDAGSALTFLSFFILLFIEGLNEFFYLAAILLGIVFIVSYLFPFEIIVISLLIISILITWYYFKPFKYHKIILFILASSLTATLFRLPLLWIIVSLIVVFALSLMYLFLSRQEKLSFMLFVGLIFYCLFSYLSIFLFSSLEPHQQERLKVWLKPSECDPRGSLYNVIQSKVAIGSGGFFGKGFLEGNMTKLKYVPEQSTDFIFSTIGEEQGFIGSLTVIILYFIMIFRIYRISETHPQKFVSYYAACVAGILFIHVLINIGMTMGLVPIIGIPLPFISKGGSSMLGFSLMLGVLIKAASKSK